MDKERLYEKIEDYLANRLPDADRAALEQEMAADAELAEEVEWHRRLAAFVQNKELLAFRRTVAEVDAEVAGAAPSPTPPSSRWWGWVLVGLAVVAGLVFFISRPAPTAAPVLPPAPQDTTLTTNPIDTTTTPEADTIAAPTPPPPPQAERNRNTPNPTLEAEITMPRDGYYKVEEAYCEAQRRAIRLEGTMLTALDPPALTLVLLDNQAKAIAQLPVTITAVPVDENIQAFAAKKRYVLVASQSARLPRGLYYARLQGDAAVGVLWVGRVKVE